MITHEELEAGKSQKGGYTKAQRASAAESRLRAYESGDAGELVTRVSRFVEELDKAGIPDTAAIAYSPDRWPPHDLTVGEIRKTASALRAADARERKAVEAEREACAQVAHDRYVACIEKATEYASTRADDTYWSASERCAAAEAAQIERTIRARTATGGEG